jgi:truncated hemoglobin YjbI
MSVTLYDAVGGAAAIHAAVDLFYDKVLADARLAPFFSDTNMTRMKSAQRAFFTTALGGPAIYTGRDLAAAHAHLPIAGLHFDAVVTHLQAALHELAVPDEIAKAILDVTLSVRPLVVQHSGDVEPSDGLAALEHGVRIQRALLAEHSIYPHVRSLQNLRTLMQFHVFAVWDFMSLLKALQTHTTCVSVPWVPEGDPTVRRFVNSIVLDEESDTVAAGVVSSHFELYLRAMQEVGADTEPIRRCLEHVRDGHLIGAALSYAGVPADVRQFVLYTFDTIHQGKPHCIAAAFTIGREEVIPTMFRSMVDALTAGDVPCPMFRAYLDRHIAMDGDDHGPLAQQLLMSLCGRDAATWAEAEAAARGALQARIGLWTGAYGAMEK